MIQERLHELREELIALKELHGLRAWDRISTFLEAQASNRAQHFLSAPLQSHDAVFAQEFMKGEVQGMLFVAKYVPARIEALEAETQELVKQLDQETDDGTERSGDASDDGADGVGGTDYPIDASRNPFGE